MIAVYLNINTIKKWYCEISLQPS